MSKRIVVYGLGKLYRRYQKHIESCENVVAHCDKNVQLLEEFQDGITPEELARNIQSYDVIMVTTTMIKVLPYLKDVLNIPVEKITYFWNRILSYVGAYPKVRFYTTAGEDGVLYGLFYTLGMTLKDIRYLEIGTNDPISGNNSYFLYQAGATGILVDPMPIVAEVSRMYRPRDKMMQIAVTGQATRDTATFYISNTMGSSSLHEGFQQEFVGQNRSIVDSYTVSLVGINDLLAQIDFVPDYMQVDAEGEDEAIVRSIDFQKYRPKVLMVEIDHCDARGLVKFMQEQGYMWYTTVGGVNAIFVDT